MTKIDTTNWQYFVVSKFFDMKAGKYYAKDDYEDGKTPLVTSSDQNNGIMTMTNHKPLYSHAITIGKVNMSVFYQHIPFIASPDVTVLIPKNKYSKNIMLFFVTLLKKEGYRFNYGNQIRLNDAQKLRVKLPVKNGEPDYDYMERFIDTHTHDYSYAAKPFTESVTPKIDLAKWEYYKLGDILKVKYGVNVELVNLEETTKDDPEGIRLVSRTENNNGISAFVKKQNTLKPNPKNSISVAGGGSVLATFLQTEEYYSGRDIYYLQPKATRVSNCALLFLVTLIRREKYRYNYGRQANKTLASLAIKLPTKDGCPDWDYMSNFVQTLPYSSQI